MTFSQSFRRTALLRALSKAMAVLDIILRPDDDFEDHYFQFGPAGLELASEGVAGWLRARTGRCKCRPQREEAVQC